MELIAPQISTEGELPYHEWFIEFEAEPNDVLSFANAINEQMCQQNIYYKDLIEGKVLQNLKITKVAKNGFQEYMKSIGKLGGQNKVPRLSNDRLIVDLLPKKSL